MKQMKRWNSRFLPFSLLSMKKGDNHDESVLSDDNMAHGSSDDKSHLDAAIINDT